MQPKKNILQKTWNVISSIGGAIGLVSFVDDWYAWSDFFKELIKTYKSITYWPYQLIALELRDWIKDFIFLGLMFWSAVFKVTYSGLREEYKKTWEKTIGAILLIFFFTTLFFIWPLSLFFSLFQVFSKVPEKRMGAIRILIYLGSTLLIFISFLIASIIMGKSHIPFWTQP